MKLNQQILTALAVAASALTLAAQPGPGNEGGPGPQPGAPGPQSQRLPPPVLLALDANHDGMVDAQELTNAAKTLLALDNNSDGQLSIEELLGQPPLKRDEGMSGSPMGNRSQQGWQPGWRRGQWHGNGANGFGQMSGQPAGDRDYTMMNQQMPPQRIVPQGRINPVHPVPQPPRIVPQQRINPLHPIAQQQRTTPVLFAALDANHDGAIDATEMGNATAVLKGLDKNNDRQLTPDDFMMRPSRGQEPRRESANRPPPAPDSAPKDR